MDPPVPLTHLVEHVLALLTRPDLNRSVDRAGLQLERLARRVLRLDRHRITFLQRACAVEPCL
eukprot:3973730-Prymnesium_polylepis.2